MPASAIAARTARAVSWICGWRPISSGRKSRVNAMPIASRLPAVRSWAPAGRRVKSVMCGDSTPSGPPDMTNAVLLEHVNLQQPDQQLATLFYVSGLLLTRDPYLMVGLDNMWINIGRTQVHLPTTRGEAQRLRGAIGLVVPDLDRLEKSL